MSNDNPFLSEKYSSDRNIIKHNLDQQALVISRMRNEPYQEVRNNLVKFYKAHKDEFKSKKAKVLVKNKHGDRELQIRSIFSVFKEVQANNYHFSPSMIGYTNSDEEECVNSIGTRQFIDNRKFYKDKRQEVPKGGDMWTKYNELQNAFKIFNNAQSGAMSSEGTPINNKTGHTSLTSSTRCLTSTANLINEQFIAGNRFYNTPENTMQAIIARLTVSNLNDIEMVINKFGLKIPTVEDVMKIVERCSRRYWSSALVMRYIKVFLDTLSGLELAAIAYTLDLVTLYELNVPVITKLFDDYVHIPDYVEGKEGIKPNTGDRYVLCISKLPPKSEKAWVPQLNEYHMSVEQKYADLFRVFFKSKIPPSGLFDVTSAIRDVVLTSDTDSSIYTVDDMIANYTTEHETVVRLNGVLTYFIRMISVDQHAQLSANMNVSQKNINLLTMKNEYFFGAYVTTSMSKHYYATQRMVEGVTNPEPDIEIKGVHLKSSKISPKIKEVAVKMMEEALFALEESRTLDAAQTLADIANLEREVIGELQKGEYSWLSKETIKVKAVYGNPDSQIYLYHDMWESVFSDKYGPAPELPYTVVKMSVDLGNKTKLESYLNSIKDSEIRERLRSFLESKGKKDMSNMYAPLERLQNLQDIPEEMKQAMDMRTVIKQNFKCIYEVLHSTGIYVMNDSISRLISDEH
ncbi:putative DNA polymerase [Aeromonas phage D6]|uniref:DNA polymerase n=2 Tax=Ludhianavirus TaxID=3044751 RepID=A0A514TVZ9_9CAUD|nr:putative tubulin like protein [Aeromonas phage LAh10]YP_010668790.1 putative DNA polymerase [Aeromonas phage D6]QDH47029.1 putative tubulin like protein [Aeromonas phage LAh10]QDJ97202.1 putative DNA polymerase [Aeromonas phage D6]